MEAITDATTWAAVMFRHSDLGDVRRQKRLFAVSAAMACAPGLSLPNIFEDWAALKGAYNLMKNPAVSADDILVGPRLETAARAAGRRVVLLVGDGTEADFTKHPTTRGLGHIGDGHGRGLMIHSVLGIDGDSREVLGIAAQRTWIRRGFKGSSKASSAVRAKRRRESAVWLETTRAAADVLSAVPTPPARVIAVDDAGADVFDYLAGCDAAGIGFVVRAAQNRALDPDEFEAGTKVRDTVAAAPVRMVTTVHVPAGPRRAARTAIVHVRAVAVTLRAPPTASTTHALTVNVVAVQEVDGPTDGTQLDWLLLTSEPIDTDLQVLQIIAWYAARWLVEEFHMGLKTGCALETRQLEEGHSLRNLLAISTPIACELLRLRSAARAPTPVAASTVLTPAQLTVLRALRPKLSAEPTAREALRWVANLGGFLMRTGDGEPGWRTIWRGFQKLRLAEIGFKVASRSG